MPELRIVPDTRSEKKRLLDQALNARCIGEGRGIAIKAGTWAQPRRAGALIHSLDRMEFYTRKATEMHRGKEVEVRVVNHIWIHFRCGSTGFWDGYVEVPLDLDCLDDPALCRGCLRQVVRVHLR